MSFIDPFEPKGEATTEAPAGSDEVESNENGVPKGSSKEVLEWVGEDQERARQALEAEQSDDKPRKGLVKELEELLEVPEDEPAAPAPVEQPAEEPTQPVAEEK